MAYEVVRSDEAAHDLYLIFDHLLESYMAFGEPLPEAFEKACKRIESMKLDMRALLRAPYQGTLLTGVRPGLRHVTKNQTVFYFEINETDQIIRIVAIFYSGQDHGRRIRGRLAGS